MALEWILIGVIVLVLLFLVLLYNGLIRMNEDVNGKWAQVETQYQRRVDLIPNLVSTVKGAANFESSTLEEITRLRSQWQTSTGINERIETANQIESTLSKLLLVAENYPQLKADGLFRDLQAQLEGTENRITVARNRYIDSVKTYNVAVRSFPSNLTAMLFGYITKPSFTVENEKAIAVPPKVDFDAPAPAPASAPAAPASGGTAATPAPAY